MRLHLDNHDWASVPIVEASVARGPWRGAAKHQGRKATIGIGLPLEGMRELTTPIPLRIPEIHYESHQSVDSHNT